MVKGVCVCVGGRQPERQAVEAFFVWKSKGTERSTQ